ncbi:hypothetical protein CXF35_00090 [Corynebacterium bovis]|uniref:Uncharacterized protein n=1 Tax=Corynebacterium bovis TaxID=36808 RepID=A0A3R8QQR6_9CORY|nr:hypothetical protein [Corynebacterium bovis]RRO84383.1 hypothetical protein CXF36_00060 [Corynebacterium bovis]RRO85251.1 hypothetical protein CXF37_00060 [Corynebacterium bovis]RRO92760.1 hypothetical protein CXF40_02815 [Corynebacterium bovis]RRQ00471.1 hypothetical protein CXF41_06700 [Corynebacterium bovis]RRQ02973.1 hypothetical protein CXF39_05170 [Corynebacterium bovis]
MNQVHTHPQDTVRYRVVVPDKPAGHGITDERFDRVVGVFSAHAGEFLAVSNHVELANLSHRLGVGGYPDTVVVSALLGANGVRWRDLVAATVRQVAEYTKTYRAG